MFAFNASAQFTSTGYYVVKNVANGKYLSVESKATTRSANGAFDALKLTETIGATNALLIEGEESSDFVINITDIKTNGISAVDVLKKTTAFGSNPTFKFQKENGEYIAIGRNDSGAEVRLAALNDTQVGTKGANNKWEIIPYATAKKEENEAADKNFSTIIGDASNDGIVDATDLNLIRAYMVGALDSSVDINIQNADVTKDGKLSIASLNMIKKMLLGIAE